jgi:hypothetical protein
MICIIVQRQYTPYKFSSNSAGAVRIEDWIGVKSATVEGDQAAQGMRDSRFYLIGFYGGIILFYLLTKPFLATLL